MRNADMPAAPLPLGANGALITMDEDLANFARQCNAATGLTKREEFARSVMQGDFAAQSPEHGEMLSAADCAHRAPLWVAAADALLAELEKSNA